MTPPLKKRLKHLRKTFAAAMAADRAIKLCSEDSKYRTQFFEANYILAFEEGFRAACTVISTPFRDDEVIPKFDIKMTPMEFANTFADALLANYYKRVIQ